MFLAFIVLPNSKLVRRFRMLTSRSLALRFAKSKGWHGDGNRASPEAWSQPYPTLLTSVRRCGFPSAPVI